MVLSATPATTHLASAMKVDEALNQPVIFMVFNRFGCTLVSLPLMLVQELLYVFKSYEVFSTKKFSTRLPYNRYAYVTFNARMAFTANRAKEIEKKETNTHAQLTNSYAGRGWE